MTIKIKQKKIFLQNYILHILTNEKVRIAGVFLGTEDPDSNPVFSPFRIQVTQKDRMSPDRDPDLQHCKEPTCIQEHTQIMIRIFSYIAFGLRKIITQRIRNLHRQKSLF